MIDGNKLIVCVGNNLFCLSLPQLKLVWLIQGDSATCFGVFKIKEGYIVHGKLEISLVSRDGKIEWQFAGKDIFTSPTGLEDFVLKDDHVLVKDWQENIYRIDFNGKGYIL